MDKRKTNVISDKELHYIEFLNRENAFRHHSYDEDMALFECVKNGDLEGALEKSRTNFNSSTSGHLSSDPLRNTKYLFVANSAIITRITMGAGLNPETAQNLSDLYIQKMDLCQTVEEVQDLQKDMVTSFTTYMIKLKRSSFYSKPVEKCINYIYHHLHEIIRLSNLAEHAGISEAYISSLFKKETGFTVMEYITSRKIEAACNMLKYSDYSYAEISNCLAFSSQSHFIQTFKKHTGMTPNKYKNSNASHGIDFFQK